MHRKQLLDTNKKEIEQDGIIYLINEEENTASIISLRYLFCSSRIVIPRTINYESKEFTVISILTESFLHSISVHAVQFAADSGIRTIQKDSFSYSSIAKLFIPASLTELDTGWCHYTQNLIEVGVDPNNPRYSCLDKKYIIGKSTKNQENFDSLVFCVRNIEEARIPKYIKYIEQSSFELCEKLNKIEFQENSELQIIEKFAFCKTSLKRISIPPSVTKICEFAFFNCTKLVRIDITSSSQLRTIEKFAFSFLPIKSIFIPATLTDLEDNWCKGSGKLTSIEVDSKNPRYLSWKNALVIGKSTKDHKNYDSVVFLANDVAEIKIPKIIKIIGSSAFCCSNRLQVVEFPVESKVRIIGKESFQSTNIKMISIPPSVTKICESAFSNCHSLVKFEIPTNSELRTIEKDAFYDTKIENLFIPKSLIDLKEGWCNCTKKLTKIEVDPMNPRYYSCFDNKFIIGKSSNNQENYDVLVFYSRNIIDDEVMIPEFIEVIGSYAFDNCRKLKRIEFSKNSMLKIIEKESFSNLMIENISIPDHVTKICEGSFNCCKKLRRIEFSANSELHIIEKEAFCKSSIESIIFPSHVTKIHDRIFFHCNYIQIIEIEENSEIQSLDKSIFINCIVLATIVMIPVNIKFN